MISIRSLLLILLIFILWRLGQRWYQTFLANQKNNPISPPPAPHREGVMVRCDYCGLHLPKEEALHSNNTYFCCEAHKRIVQQPDN